MTEFVANAVLTSRIFIKSQGQSLLVSRASPIGVNKTGPLFPLTSELRNSSTLRWAGPKEVFFSRQVAERPEITLCLPGQKALTTSRFIWKVNTHFTMLASQLIPSALTSSVSSILQFPTEAVRPVRFLRHMTTQLLQDAAQVIPNQQTLINVVSKRVRQLGLGHRPLIETTPRMSLTDIALTEIIAGKLTYESLEGDGA